MLLLLTEEGEFFATAAAADIAIAPSSLSRLDGVVVEEEDFDFFLLRGRKEEGNVGGGRGSVRLGIVFIIEPHNRHPLHSIRRGRRC